MASKSVKRVYFDNNATTPLDSEVLKAMLPFLKDEFGNASTIYSWGRTARKAVEEARAIVAEFIGANDDDIYFTSGGTESNNFAIKGIAFANQDKGKHIITTTIEHPSVLNISKYLAKLGFDITYVPVDSEGVLDFEKLKKAIRPDTILVSIMTANNEIGTIEPIEKIGEFIKEINISRKNKALHNIYFHTDGVQVVGKIGVDVNNMNVDLLSISGHKLNGPKGVGALYIRKGVKIESFMHGGHQEHRKRAGTENVAGIVGLSKAVSIAAPCMKKEEKHLRGLKKRLFEGLSKEIPEIFLNGTLDEQKSLPGTLNISFKYVEGESVVMNLDIAGVAVSSGSACMSDTLTTSHVLKGIGQDIVLAQGAVRFSLGKFNKEDDVDYVIKVLPPIMHKLRQMSPLYEN